MDWFEILNKHGEFTVGERSIIEEFYSSLTTQQLAAINLICHEIYKLGRFTRPQDDEIVKPSPDFILEYLKSLPENSLDNQNARERLHEIAGLCVDWDGARSARTLGELVNEIWAYSVYPVKGD